ncbi:hypothetical protein [uncultured Clostridium sp.]|uniref:hypothetical protein n=1 Tax=uncultured Clostridium sp. TaxID=59620 RepID=UPI0026F16C5E|nr:hypothetical protein [uncultured Clostridium sp.]
MYITYSMYRSKNNDFIETRKISLPIGDFRQLLNLDGIIMSVIGRDIRTIPMIKKFGTAYVGEIRCIEFEIVDEDNTDAMNEEQFREYFKEISNVPLIWSKKEEVKSGKENTNQSSEHKTRKSNSKKVGDEENTK